MPIQAFLLLPEQDEVFINIGDTPEDFKGVFDQIIQISDVIHKNQDIDLWYDSKNLSVFLEQIKNLFDNDQYLLKPTMLLKTKLEKVSRDWRDRSKQDREYNYFIWLFDTKSAKEDNNTLAEITERIFCYKTGKYLLLNICQSIKTNKKQIITFKDRDAPSYLPNFINIEFVSDADELLIWLKKTDVSNWIFLEGNRFRKTKFHQQGAVVYQDITTKQYWYLDNLHKDHYEVFDAQRNHIGIADLQGNIDKTRKVAGRKM